MSITNAFVSAVQQNQIRGTTFNGAETLTTSSNPVLDLFYLAGNRNVDLSKHFDLAVRKDKKLSYRVALWARDIRGGAGERATFRNLLKHLEKHYVEDLILLLPKIPEVGRWDDLLIFNDDKVVAAAHAIYKKALLEDKNGLAAKWAPRKGEVAKRLSVAIGFPLEPMPMKLKKREGQEQITLKGKTLQPARAYRKLLVDLTKVVESQMCAKDWDKIIFDHVPSLASARYQKAFNKHCGDRYTEYKAGLVKVDPETGKTERKINAAAVYPYDVIKSIDNGDRQVAVAQWEALPNYLGDNKILPMVDVSGSMTSWGYYGQRSGKNGVTTNVTPMQIALSLGLYTANKQTGAFNGMFLTFSDNPVLQKLTGDIVSMKTQMQQSHWAMSTNIEAGFNQILNLAKANNVPQEDMPEVLLVLSDMEFNEATKGNYYGRTYTPPATNFQAAERAFAAAGYKLPKIVFWAINNRANNVPVSFMQNGTALVSGFSPALFKSVLSNDLVDFTPESIMIQTLRDSRYDIQGLTV